MSKYHVGQRVIELNYLGEAIIVDYKQVPDPENFSDKVDLYRICPIGWQLPDGDEGWCMDEDLVEKS